MTRVGIDSAIEWELSSIPSTIPAIELGIGIKKGIGIELELTKIAGIDKGIDFLSLNFIF